MAGTTTQLIGTLYPAANHPVTSNITQHTPERSNLLLNLKHQLYGYSAQFTSSAPSLLLTESASPTVSGSGTNLTTISLPSEGGGGGGATGVNTGMLSMFSLIFIVGQANFYLAFRILQGSLFTCRVTRTIVFNLAVANGSLTLSIPFLLYAIAKRAWLLGPAVCKLYWTMEQMNKYSSIVFLTYLCFDRYFAIAKPARSAALRRLNRTRIACGGCWVGIGVAMLPIMVFAGFEHASCRIHWPGQAPFGVLGAVYGVACFVLLYPLPVVIICYLSSQMVLQLHRVTDPQRIHARSGTGQPPSASPVPKPHSSADANGHGHNGKHRGYPSSRSHKLLNSRQDWHEGRQAALRRSFRIVAFTAGRYRNHRLVPQTAADQLTIESCTAPQISSSHSFNNHRDFKISAIDAPFQNNQISSTPNLAYKNQEQSSSGDDNKASPPNPRPPVGNRTRDEPDNLLSVRLNYETQSFLQECGPKPPPKKRKQKITASTKPATFVVPQSSRNSTPAAQCENGNCSRQSNLESEPSRRSDTDDHNDNTTLTSTLLCQPVESASPFSTEIPEPSTAQPNIHPQPKELQPKEAREPSSSSTDKKHSLLLNQLRAARRSIYGSFVRGSSVNNRVGSATGQRSGGRPSRRYRKVTRVIIATAAAHVILWGPFWFDHLGWIIWREPPTEIHLILIKIISFMPYINSAIFPYFYLISNK